MNIIETLENEQLRNDIPAFRPGDTVRVHVKVVEGKTERIQVFEGHCYCEKKSWRKGNIYCTSYFLWRRCRKNIPDSFSAFGKD